MVEDIKGTLWGRDLFLISQVLEFENIQGGIVFALPEATLDIQGCQVPYGKTVDWLKRLRDARPSPRVREAQILPATEKLLKRNYELVPDRFRSMEAYARDVVKNAQERLEKWTSE